MYSLISNKGILNFLVLAYHQIRIVKNCTPFAYHQIRNSNQTVFFFLFYNLAYSFEFFAYPPQVCLPLAESRCSNLLRIQVKINTVNETYSNEDYNFCFSLCLIPIQLKKCFDPFSSETTATRNPIRIRCSDPPYRTKMRSEMQPMFPRHLSISKEIPLSFQVCFLSNKNKLFFKFFCLFLTLDDKHFAFLQYTQRPGLQLKFFFNYSK